MTRIFISHSHADEAIAENLVNYLSAALTVEDADIRCTSVVGHQLLVGSNIESQLRKDINGDIALIGLLTQNSLRSQWVLFELGAAWGMGKLVIPILGAGVKKEDLPGPLEGRISISIEDKRVTYALSGMIQQLTSNLNEIEEKLGNRISAEKRRDEFISELKAWKPQLPATDPSQQQEIEQLKTQIQELEFNIEELERSHKEQLGQLEKALTLSQQEKEELERDYQEQKQELEQELNLKIKQLEKEQEHSKKLEEKERVLETKIKELEKERSQKDDEIMRLRERLIERSPYGFVQQALKSFSFEVLTVNERGEEVKRETKEAQYFTEELGNGVSLDMIAIPGGKFMMGTEDQEIERLVEKNARESFRREKPQHEVTVQPFLMSKYPIIQAQYERVMGENHSKFKDDERLPVENVTWKKAVEFCERISQETGKKYRLPTEAEWEYACRAGTTTAYSFGNEITDKLANYDNKIKKTTAPGKYSPNAFGLYDMHGNVWEWCQDDWHDNYNNAPTDCKPWVSGESSTKVRRGGSWSSKPFRCRSAYRVFRTPLRRDNPFGFRVVCVASLQ